MKARSPYEVERIVYDCLEEGFGVEDIVVMHSIRRSTVQAVIDDLRSTNLLAEIYSPLPAEDFSDQIITGCVVCGGPLGAANVSGYCRSHIHLLRKIYQ